MLLELQQVLQRGLVELERVHLKVAVHREERARVVAKEKDAAATGRAGDELVLPCVVAAGGET